MQFLPWYNPDLIAFLEIFLKKEHQVFEYGGGNSTLYYSAKVLNVCTIETKKEWIDFVLVHNSKQNIEIKLCENLQNFASEIQYFQVKKFDLIVVDSRDRAKCLSHCLPFLKANGIIILDNSERGNLKLAKEGLILKGFTEKLYTGKRIDGIFSTASVFFKNEAF
jgi:predicted O-methyltransferase YrrM